MKALSASESLRVAACARRMYEDRQDVTTLDDARPSGWGGAMISAEMTVPKANGHSRAEALQWAYQRVRNDNYMRVSQRPLQHSGKHYIVPMDIIIPEWREVYRVFKSGMEPGAPHGGGVRDCP